MNFGVFRNKNRNMKRKVFKMAALALMLSATAPAFAQFDLGRALGGLVKAGQALTVSDSQMAEYVKESVAKMDKENTVLPDSDPYSQRLARLTKGIKDADGIPLNFKVYKKDEINAFACPDGSVRVYTGLMDMMTDDELLGVVGHEIGHVVKRHSKNAFKNQLLTGALKDELAASSGKIAALTDSQLGTLGEGLINAKYSRKQENEADDCGYDFLVGNGRNPYGMVMAFEKMSAMEQKGGASANSYIAKMFSSHPDTQARIKHMSERCSKDGYSRPVVTTTKTTTTAKKSTTTKTTKKTTAKKTAKKTTKKR